MPIASSSTMNKARNTGNRLPKAGGKSTGRIRSSESRQSEAALRDRIGKADTNAIQISSKTGMESSSQKEDSSRYYREPPPPSNPVSGAFGKSGVLSEPEETMVHPDEDADSNRGDFMAERRRQNKRAKK